MGKEPISFSSPISNIFLRYSNKKILRFPYVNFPFDDSRCALDGVDSFPDDITLSIGVGKGSFKNYMDQKRKVAVSNINATLISLIM